MRCSAVLLLALLGCSPPASQRPPLAMPEAPWSPPPAEGVPIAHQPDLRASVRAPARVPYLVEALGVGGRSVALRLTNAGTRTVDFGWPRVAFTAERDGVSFLCNDHLDPSGEARAPTSLAPGQSLVLESNLDCAMPLPGRYDVGVYVAFGGSARTDRGDLVRTFRLDVEEGSVVPRPYPSRPGLFVAMTGGQATPPLPPLAWARGDYHVVVAIVNDSSHPLEVGPAHLAFLTYKKGSPLPCAGQKEPVLFPEQLSPGSYKVVQAPVACAPSEEGTYDIIGRFTLDAVGEEIEIGRVSLKVNRDPPLFLPEPWPSHAPIPSEGTTAPAGDSTK